MKIKAKNKKSTTKKPMYPNGGYIKYSGGGDNNIPGANESGMGTSGLSQDWGNISTASTSTPTMNAGAKYGAAFGQNLASGLPSLVNTYQNPQASAADKTRATAQMTGDAAASAIPGFGAFYGTARGITSSIQDAIPGKDMVDKKTGVHVNVKNSQAGRAADQWLTPDHTHASNSWALAAAANNSADKAKYAMMGIGDLFGFTKVARVAQSAMGKSPEGLDLVDPKMQAIQQANSKFPTANPNIPQDNTQMMANGGFGDNKSKTSTHLLEKYKVLPHSQLNPNFANAHLDGKPIQLEKNETIFRAANGGDYAFSPNLMDGDKTIAERSIQIDKKYTKPYFDKVAEDTKKLALNDLVKKNESLRIAKEEKGLPKASGGLGSYNIDGSYQQPSFIGTGGKIEALLNSDQVIEGDPNSQINFQGKSQFSDNSGNLDLKTNSGALSQYIPNSPKLENRMKSLQPTENNLTSGDYMQLAGSAVAPLANLANYFRKPEKIKGHFDRTPITPNQQGVDLNPMFLAQNTATKGISEGTSSDAVRRANLANVVSGTQQNIGNALLQNKLLNNTLRGQYEDRLAGRTRANAEVAHRQDVEQSQTNAVRQSYLNTAAAQVGQSMVNFGKFKNQGKTNEIEYSTLQNLASNYGLDPKEYEDFLKSKGVKIKYK